MALASRLMSDIARIIGKEEKAVRQKFTKHQLFVELFLLIQFFS